MSVSADQLKAFVERIEKLESDKKDISLDIREVYQELGAVGYDKKIVRKIVANRRKNKADLIQEQELLETYSSAIEGI